MSAKDTSEPAFPLKEATSYDNEGMTLRDYFAAKAMQGALSNAYRYQMKTWEIAKEAYEMADAMLEARK